VSAVGAAPARAALAGNPSDGYGGAVLAITVDALCARARIAAAPARAEPLALVDAAVARFARDHAPAATGTAVQWATTIPQSVGLGGSSALVIATLRALCEQHRVELAPRELAELALAVEVEDLGIAAGPQDRIAQSFGGLTFMDFAAGRYETLERRRLPPLLVAWRRSGAAPSGPVHDDLQSRFARGERAVLGAMATLAGAAHDARTAVLAGDPGALATAVDASFDARAAMLKLAPAHVELIEVARSAGAAANYAGSGGAIVCVCRNDDQRLAVSEALVNIGCEVLSLSGRFRKYVDGW
jgi:glucuronokinase